MDREAPKHIDQGIRLAGNNRYDLWKFYQNRADTIRARLWTIGTWLVALISALAALAHQGDIIGLRPGFPGIAILLPWPAFFIAMLGLILVILTFFIVFDNLRHIIHNFTYANYVSSEQWIPAALPRHTRNGAYTLQIILFLFLVGYGWVLYLSGRAVLGDRPDARAPAATEAAKVTFLTINDVYRIEGVDRGARGGLPRLRALRQELQKADPELLVLHAGDVIAPSLLSATYDGAQMIDMLNRLDADALAFDPRMFAVFGNHEFDKQELGQAGILADRVRESQFSWLRSNLGFALDGGGLPLVRGANLLASTIVEVHGVKVGLFGLTTDVTQPAYVIEIEDPLESARRFSRMLRAEGADLVVALTHLTLAEDMAILEGLGTAGPDLIIGGHEHTRQMAEVDGRWVLKADADAVGAWVVKVTPRSGEPPLVEPEYRLLAGDQPLPDGQLSRDVAAWRTRHDLEFCTREKAPPGCLDQQVGETATVLVAAEEEIRSCETNFGDWIADQMRAAFPGAQAAFINAGSLRLNQNIPKGPILRRDIAELLQFDNQLALVPIRGSTLREVAANAVSGWPGNGRWLQISGFAFEHDQSDRHAPEIGRLELIEGDRRRPLKDDEVVQVVTTDYLLGARGDRGDRDDYDMLPKWADLAPGQARRSLREVVRGAIGPERKAIDPPAPAVARRIVQANAGPPCNPGK